MSRECFDIVDENNQPTGMVKSRDEVHRDRVDWHRTTHIWIVNDRWDILCQQRSWKKDGNPGMWQSFFGGHVKAGQTVEECLREELREEIGIDVATLSETPVFLHVRRWETAKHFGYTYVLRWNGRAADVRFNDGEVEQVAWLDRATLEREIAEGKFCNKISGAVAAHLSF